MSHDRLSEQVRLLGSILGETIAELEGKRLQDRVEQIRTLAKEWRGGRSEAAQELSSVVGNLDANEMDVVARAFAWWFVLVNLAEERERVRVLRDRSDEAAREGKLVEESLEEAISLARKTADLGALLESFLVEPVLTAHPTEARRRVVAARTDALRDLLREIEARGLDHDRELLLREQIAALWTTDPMRRHRPTVMDEVRSGLIVFDSTLFEAVARLHRSVAMEIGESASSVPVLFRFASWIGGDRDGNPNVTPAVTRQTLIEHAQTAVRLHRRAIERLHGHLSVARSRGGEDLQPLIDRDIEILGEELSSGTERLEPEPIRWKLALLWRRLGQTLASLDSFQEGRRIVWQQGAIRSADELLEDLSAIDASLRRAGLGRLADGRFALVLLQARIFGLHLAPLDVRQHAEKFESLLQNLFRRYAITEDWSALDESERLAILERELSGSRPLTSSATDLTDEERELTDTFSTIAWAHATFGVQSIATVILSMTTRASDLMGALLLLRDAGVREVDVVPLFETIDDLRNGAGVLRRLFDSATWREHLDQRGRTQQIMIGYSDSNKDGGYLAANWHLYQAQQSMAGVCADAGIRPLFFHGRGGSIGRGGGPANRAILAQPAGTVQGALRLTEQGEVIADRYGDPEVADRHMGQIVNAVIRMTLEPPPEPSARWVDAIDEMARVAEREYRDLVHETPELTDYFHQTTPVGILPELNIGSRPASRKSGGGIGSLRAIPWVFAWTQTRVNLPGWYALGAGIEGWAGSDEEHWTELRTMYRDWRFFAAVIDNAQMSMRKADLRIARFYSQLADERVRSVVWPRIESEYVRTRAAILRITGCDELLGGDSWLSSSIQLRNPYIDPMNAIQVALMRRLREADGSEREWMLDAILVCVNGISGGLRNTG